MLELCICLKLKFSAFFVLAKFVNILKILV
jgi:hypothetical protein